MGRVFVVIALAALSRALLACDETEEAAAPMTTVSPTEIPSPEPTSIASTTSSPIEPTPPGPEGWETYDDPPLGFSLRYPPDLVFKDHTDPNSSPGINERAFEFQSPDEQSRGLTISISSNDRALSLEAWAAEYALCVRSTFTQGSVDGRPAVFCNAEPAGVKQRSVIFDQKGKIVYLSSLLPASEFELIVASVRL